jgi:hypothetical protein
LQAKLDALLARQEEINKQLEAKQTEVTAVSRVLFDILSKIFTIYVRDLDGSPYDIAVCKMWRTAIFHHSPWIWRRIVLNVPQVTPQSSWEGGSFVCSSPGVLERVLKRSKVEMVSLRIINATHLDSIDLSDLLPYRRIFEHPKQRWGSLDIELPPIKDTSNKAGVTAATLIASLTHPSYYLRHLKLTNIDLKEEILTHSSMLETLTLTRCQLDLSKASYPALVELHFDSSSTPSNSIKMPNLLLLRYRGPTLTPLMQITAPSLQTLDLASLDDPTWLDGGWGSRFNPNAVLLHAGGWDRVVFKAFLSWMTNIETLNVEGTTFLTAMEMLEELDHQEMVAQENVNEGETNADTQRPVACPKLSALDITVTEEVCEDCISQLRSLSMAVLRKHSQVPVLRFKFNNGMLEEICLRDH